MARSIRMRPTFDIVVGSEGPSVLERLRDQLAAPDAEFSGQVRSNHAFVRLPEEKSSLLSPHLNLELIDGPDGTVLHGRFSPHPNVWTGFMAVYILLVLVAVGGAMFGWAQTTVDEYPWGFWLIPAAAALYAFVYGAAVIGQGLTADEMYELRALVDEACEGCRRHRADGGPPEPAGG